MTTLLGAAADSDAESKADDIVATLESVPTSIPVLAGVATDETTELVPLGGASTDAAAVEDVSDVSLSGGPTPLAVDLLAADDADSVSVSQDGIEVIDNGDDSSTVPLKYDDGSLRVIYVIDSVDAPSTYSIDVDLPAGSALTPIEGGGLLATGADGQMVLGVTPAWAFDAAGAAVPTHYVVDDSRVTQVVDHSSGDYQYPISVDPYLGERLFHPMQVNRNGSFNGAAVYSGKLTPWAINAGLTSSGYRVMRYNGWAEFTTAWPSIASNKSLEQQYQCHALWGRAIIGAGIHWDIEASRAPNSNRAAVLDHKCNW